MNGKEDENSFKKMVFNLLNFKGLDLFEKKLGMGEDPLIGYMLLKQGNFFHYPELTFFHNYQKDGAYSVDLYAYSKRVVFFRLFLSIVKIRLDKKSPIFACIFYRWHTIFRILGIILNYILNRNLENCRIMASGVSGCLLSFSFKYNFSDAVKIIWYNRAKEVVVNNNVFINE